MISKILKEYGDSKGRIFLTFQAANLIVYFRHKGVLEKETAEEMQKNLGEYAVKIYGEDLWRSYLEFSGRYSGNGKLKTELNSRLHEFTDKKVIDAIEHQIPGIETDKSRMSLMRKIEGLAADQTAVRCHFANREELLLYKKFHVSEARSVTWVSSEEYLEEIRQGTLLLAQRQYDRAIDAFGRALGLNPVGLTARFGICSACLRLRKIPEAKKMLESTVRYLYSNSVLATYYWHLGCIQAAEDKILLAACCESYSRFLAPEQKFGRLVMILDTDMMEMLNDPQKVEENLAREGLIVRKREIGTEETEGP